MTMVYEANTRTHRWTTPNGRRCSFTPTHKLVAHGNVDTRASRNPTDWSADAETDPMLAARVFVGLSVGQDAAFDVDDVVAIVKKVRAAQGKRDKRHDRHVDASFIAQRGLYTSRKSGDVVEEDSVQIVLLNTDGLPKRQFESEIVELAEQLATRLDQEEVIVDLQENGISKKTLGVKP